MGEMAEVWRAQRDARKERKASMGRPCPECVRLLPKAHPSKLLPGQRCRIHGYVDPRPRDE